MPIVTPHLSFLTFVGYTPSQERYGTHTSMGVAGARGASQQTPMTHEPPVETTTIQHKYKSCPTCQKGKAATRAETCMQRNNVREGGWAPQHCSLAVD